jgi:type III secretory pathway component EscU
MNKREKVISFVVNFVYEMWDLLKIMLSGILILFVFPMTVLFYFANMTLCNIICLVAILLFMAHTSISNWLEDRKKLRNGAKA